MTQTFQLFMPVCSFFSGNLSWTAAGWIHRRVITQSKLESNVDVSFMADQVACSYCHMLYWLLSLYTPRIFNFSIIPTVFINQLTDDITITFYLFLVMPLMLLVWSGTAAVECSLDTLTLSKSFSTMPLWRNEPSCFDVMLQFGNLFQMWIQDTFFPKYNPSCSCL